MNNITAHTHKIRERLKKVLKGEKIGYSCGLPKLDSKVGRMEAGQVWIIGGYTGTGKSFFILNMIEGMLEANEANIAMFSTELSVEAYIKRQIFMRAGVYELEYTQNPKDYYERIDKEIDNLAKQAIIKANRYNVYGDISSFEQIEKIIKKDKPNIAFIDYMQELSVMGKYSEEDVMPILAKKFKQLALEQKVVIVLVSQVNNYAVRDGNMEDKNILPFSRGKEIGNAAHTAIVLTRNKKDGELSKTLKASVMKSRSGNIGYTEFKILKGYKLLYIPKNAY